MHPTCLVLIWKLKRNVYPKVTKHHTDNPWLRMVWLTVLALWRCGRDKHSSQTVLQGIRGGSPVIPVFGRLRQVDHEFHAILSSLTSPYHLEQKTVLGRWLSGIACGPQCWTTNNLVLSRLRPHGIWSKKLSSFFFSLLKTELFGAEAMLLEKRQPGDLLNCDSFPVWEGGVVTVEGHN